MFSCEEAACVLVGSSLFLSVRCLAATSERLNRRHNGLLVRVLQRRRSPKTSGEPGGSTSEIKMVAGSFLPTRMPEVLSGENEIHFIPLHRLNSLLVFVPQQTGKIT